MSRREIVSDQQEPLILVDEQDQAIGFKSKQDCHTGEGHLHRAFSIFLFDKNGDVLLQRRSADKWLWPEYWSNSCCSHPRRGESMEEALRRRLEQELGMTCDLFFLYKFKYQAQFGEVGSENELCSVYYGIYDGQIDANEAEIAEWCYMKPELLDEKLENGSEQFTPWLQMEWRVIRSEYMDKIF